MNICLPRNEAENRAMCQRIVEAIPNEDIDGTERAVFSAFFLDEFNRPYGGVMFYGLSKHNVFISLAIFNKRGCTRQKFEQGFRLAFEAPLNVYRITALVSSTNRLSQKLCERLGFHKEGECIGLNGTEEDVTYIYRYTQKDWYGSKFYGKLES